MIPPTVASFLDAHKEITLFCLDGEGRPVGYPMLIFTRSEREVFFSTYRKSAKVQHLERDPRAALLSIWEEGPKSVRWVSMTGNARIWQPSEDDVDRLFPKSTGDARVPDTIAPLLRQRTLEGKRTMIRVELDSPGLLTVEEAVL